MKSIAGPGAPPPAGGGAAPRIARAMALLCVGAVLLSVAWVLAYRVVDPPVTFLMVLRRWDGSGLDHDPVALSAISPFLVTAVIASEDERFCGHHGFDWVALRAAWAHDQRGGRLLGGSTISMQTAKNAFLWPGRSYLRKGVEAWFTALMEALWPKARIMAVYLNSIEWGDGIYGAGAAARRYFHQSAAVLSRREAALLAAVLPDPRRWSPVRPSPFIRARAAAILARMAVVERDGLGRCVPGPGAADE